MDGARGKQGEGGGGWMNAGCGTKKGECGGFGLTEPGVELDECGVETGMGMGMGMGERSLCLSIGTFCFRLD
jgi:hypothetical protein